MRSRITHVAPAERRPCRFHRPFRARGRPLISGTRPREQRLAVCYVSVSAFAGERHPVIRPTAIGCNSGRPASGKGGGAFCGWAR